MMTTTLTLPGGQTIAHTGEIVGIYALPDSLWRSVADAASLTGTPWAIGLSAEQGVTSEVEPGLFEVKNTVTVRRGMKRDDGVLDYASDDLASVTVEVAMRHDWRRAAA